MNMCEKSEMDALVDLSARLGSDPLLIQAASGNTSVKVNDSLWVKASGKWLADARDEPIFTCVDYAKSRRGTLCCPSTNGLKPSIETAMHATLPHKVVVHVHSVNTIAWAVRRDGPEQLQSRLDGLRWHWIPHVPSGAPLAHEIAIVLRHSPDANIFVLANHGLVVCGGSCEAAEALLQEVEQRLAIHPRQPPAPDRAPLEQVACEFQWRLPNRNELHSLGTDRIAQAILAGGVLYPCQAIFLAPSLTALDCVSQLPEAIVRYHEEHGTRPPFIILEERGVLVSETITRAEYEMLVGLMEIVRRLDDSAPIRYLTEAEVSTVLNADAYHYRALVEAAPSRC